MGGIWEELSYDRAGNRTRRICGEEDKIRYIRTGELLASMSPRDPGFSAKSIIETGPYTSTQRDEFLAGNSAGTKFAPHHRHQIPVRDGRIIDEIPGPGHPSGNQHTAGTPNRHPAKSIFNS